MSSLFSPIRLGQTELANRIVVAPMCQYSSDDGSATDWHLAHLGMLANCGAGLVVVEASTLTALEPVGLTATPGQVREATDRLMAAIGALTGQRPLAHYPARRAA